MIEVREVLRAWLGGAGLRTVAGQAGVDRKTVRRYVAAAQAAGVVREGSLDQLTEEVIGQVVVAVRPVRASGHGAAWEALEAEHARIAEWVEQDLSVVKISDLLARRGVLVPYRTPPAAVFHDIRRKGRRHLRRIHPSATRNSDGADKKDQHKR